MNYTPIDALKKIASMDPDSKAAYIAREALATAGVQCLMIERDFAAMGRQQHRDDDRTPPAVSRPQGNTP